MIKAAHHPLYEVFFGAYLWAHMRVAFRYIRIQNNYADTGKPVLLISNHFSWWDGFIARHVNNKVFKRQLHVMMEEEQLIKHMFLRRLGAFSIKKNSRSAIESLHYATSLLNDPGNLLLLFPQGRFQSLHRQILTFEKGWFRIIQGSPSDIEIVFMAILTDYFSSPRPGLDIYIESITADTINKYAAALHSDPPDKESAACNKAGDLAFDARSVESAYNGFYKQSIERHEVTFFKAAKPFTS